jgi:hypothetical protein
LDLAIADLQIILAFVYYILLACKVSFNFANIFDLVNYFDLDFDYCDFADFEGTSIALILAPGVIFEGEEEILEVRLVFALELVFEVGCLAALAVYLGEKHQN